MPVYHFCPGYEQLPVPLPLPGWLEMYCCARRQSRQGGPARLLQMRCPALLASRFPEPAGQRPGQYDRRPVRCPGARQPPLPPLSRRNHLRWSGAQSDHRADPAWRCAHPAARSTDGARVSLATRLIPGTPAVRPRFELQEPYLPREWPWNDSDSQRWDTGSAAVFSDEAERYRASLFQTRPPPAPSSIARQPACQRDAVPSDRSPTTEAWPAP